MSKTFAILTIAMFLISLAPAISAEETLISTQIETEEAGITPESPIAYSAEQAMEQIRMALTFNKEKKTELCLRYAEERLAETEKLYARNQTKYLEKAQERYEKQIQRIEKLSDEIDSDGNTENAKEALELSSNIEARLQIHQEKVALIKSRILERQRERMTTEQIAHLEEVFSKVQNKTKIAEQKTAQKRENSRIAYRTLANLTDEELNTLVQEIESKNTIYERRNVIKETVKNEIQERKQARDGTGEYHEQIYGSLNNNSDETELEIEEESEESNKSENSKGN